MMDVFRIVEILHGRHLILSTAESCTGGLLAGKLIEVPGASDVYSEGFITYSNRAKEERLGVQRTTLQLHGAVSAECAVEMAQGAARVSHSDIGLSTTGIAGPGGGTSDKPVGLVYIGISNGGQARAIECRFAGDRASVRAQAVNAALGLLEEELDL